MLSVASSKFDLLPTRPPTPPKEILSAVDEAITFLDDSNEVDRLLGKARSNQQASNHILETSPASSCNTVNGLNATRKVGFSPDATILEAAQKNILRPSNAIPARFSPSSRGAKPVRSILKQSAIPSPLTPQDLASKLIFSPEQPGSFARMLKSVILQLGSADMSSRLDAYLAMNGALKAHEKFPDVAAMSQKMDLMMQFLSRDMAWKNSEGQLDVNIVSQAIKLTLAIMFEPTFLEALDDDFRNFVLDRSIAVIEPQSSKNSDSTKQSSAPKAIVKLHMYLLAQQRFRPHLMTAARAESILNALHTIEERCSGNSVIATRLVIYQRLSHQAANTMLNRMREWLEHVFHGMLSNVSEIRLRAIETCTQAGLTYGLRPQAGKVLHELFQVEVDEGVTYCDYLISRLSEMIAAKDAAACVPRIWSSVVLFFRSKRFPLEKWATFRPWLRVLQKCLNSSDIKTKYEAMLAWNKLVFAIMPDGTTAKNSMSMLLAPISSTLEKRGADKHSQQFRQQAFETYYNLLHYVLRPGLSYEEYDAAWDICVDPMLQSISKPSGPGRDITCRILLGLLNGSAGVWNQNLAFEPTMIRPEELPKLDPRWVRLRLGKLLKIVEPLMLSRLSCSGEYADSIDAVWRNLLQTISDAGSQEVRTSSELRKAIALLCNMFHSLWGKYERTDSTAYGSNWLHTFVSLVDCMIEVLGGAPLVEEILQTLDGCIVEAAPSPSHRNHKAGGPSLSALTILFGMFLQPPDEEFPLLDNTYMEDGKRLLKTMISCRPGFPAKLELLEQNLASWFPAYVSRSNTETAGWCCVAGTATHVLTIEQAACSGQDSQSLGSGLRSAVNILLAGLTTWQSHGGYDAITVLYDAIHVTTKSLAGDSGVTVALSEPIAKALCDTSLTCTLDLKLHIATRMLKAVEWPVHRQAVEQARKAIGHAAPPPYRKTPFDPFDHVYTMINALAVGAYQDSDAVGEPAEWQRSFLSAVIGFLEKSPTSTVGIAIRKTQAGVTAWIADISRRTGASDEAGASVKKVWLRIIRLLERLPNADSTTMRSLEGLLVAGFSSPHKAIANATITYWNQTFGVAEALDYPQKLANVLRSRALDADIFLPTFPQSDGESVPASLPSFFDTDSQTETNDALPKPVNGLRSSNKNFSAFDPVSRSPYFTANSLAISPKGSISSPARRPRSIASATPKARLRHDNSQIEFAPIESSPIVPDGESQVLTDHQREVRARQQQDAQLFADLSSSPLAQSTALPRKLVKRLSFTDDAGEGAGPSDEPGTPLAGPDTTGLMSDDLPSSPTPSAKGGQGFDRESEDDHRDAQIESLDPPSSPPRASHDQPEQVSDREGRATSGEHQVDGTDLATSRMDDSTIEHDHELPEAPTTSAQEDDRLTAPAAGLVDLGSDLPSDTILPDEQLHHEEEVASRIQATSSGDAQGPRMQIKSPTPRLRRGRSAGSASPKQSSEAESQSPDTSPKSVLEVSRIENSFVEDLRADNELASTSTGVEQPPSTRGMKRKSTEQQAYPAKIRKQSSKLLTTRQSSLPSVSGSGDNQRTNDGNMEDEIVVAGSQRSSSPPAARLTDARSASVSQAGSQVSEIGEHPVEGVKAEEQGESASARPKRARGRPRASQTPTPASSLPQAAIPRSLKRKASMLSTASAIENVQTSSQLESSPMSLRSSKRIAREATESFETPKSSTPILECQHQPKRRSPSVIIQSTSQPRIQQSDVPDDLCATPEKQLLAEEAASASQHDRPITSPRSILKRLKDALTDFKGMILGSAEEREFDDVLFEFRRETFEAGRRGRT